MFNLILLTPAIYVGLHYLIGLPIPLSCKIVVFALMLAVAESHLIYKLVFGNRFSPELPHLVLIIINWIFGVLVIFSLFLIVIDIIHLIIFCFSGNWASKPHYQSFALLITCLLSTYAVWQSIKVPAIKTINVVIKNLPTEFDNYRLVQLTDLHASPLLNHAWINQVVAKTNTLNADTIVLTGDIADGTVENRQFDVEPLKQLRASNGKYAIPGNHEYYSGFTPWMQHIEALGFKLLLNQAVPLPKKQHKIWLAGITDEAALRYQQTGPDLHLALQNVNSADPIILLDHRPSNAMHNAEQGIALQLSGHTHGGMIYGLDQVVKRANNGWYSGLYQIGDMQLYVSNGTGLWNGFSLRLGHPSEITLLILRCA